MRRLARQALGALAVAGPWLLLAGAAAAAALTCWFAWSLALDGIEGLHKPRVFYDQYHVVRHKVGGRNERGEWEYNEVSGYNELIRTLEREGYDVHVHRPGMGRLRPGDLDGFDVFFIGEQSQRRPYLTRAMTPEEREVVFDFVREGGGLWVTFEHTNAYDMNDWTNAWMEGTGIRARNDSICEPNGTELSRDWVELRTIDHPVTEGVEVAYTCNGCSLDTEHGIAFSSPESWSDAWDPADPPVYNGDNERSPDELAGPLAGLAAVEYGEGRIVATCDHNLLSNPTLYTGDHHRFLLNAMAWLAQGEHLDPDVVALPLAALLTLLLATGAARGRRWPQALVALGLGTSAGLYGAWVELEEPHRSDILLTDTHAPTLRVHSKDPPDLFTFFEHLMKDRHTYAWHGLRIEAGFDALFLNSPTEPLSAAELGVVDGYLAAGRTVVYLGSRRSMRSPAGEQLLDRFGLRVRTKKRSDAGETREYRVEGPPALTAGVEKWRVAKSVRETRVDGEGADVLVRLVGPEHSLDFIAVQPVGGGRFVLVAQAELFGNRNLRTEAYRMDGTDLSMHLAAWATGQR